MTDDGAEAAESAISVEATQRLRAPAWTSALSVTDFAAHVTTGLLPVGVVQGCTVMQWGWNMGVGFGPLGMAQNINAPNIMNWRCPHGFVSADHRAFGSNFEQTWVEQCWHEGFKLAKSRMLEEAKILGAHGVVGVTLDIEPMQGTGAIEFRCRGTAVIDEHKRPTLTPFSTFLAGQRLKKLHEAGYAPIAVVATMSSVRMYGYCITHFQMTGQNAGIWSGGLSGGIGGSTSIDQVIAAHRFARQLARNTVKSHLQGDLLHGAEFDVREHEIGEGDLEIECILKGNRVHKIGEPIPIGEPEAVLHLA